MDNYYPYLQWDGSVEQQMPNYNAQQEASFTAPNPPYHYPSYNIADVNTTPVQKKSSIEPLMKYFDFDASDTFHDINTDIIMTSHGSSVPTVPFMVHPDANESYNVPSPMISGFDTSSAPPNYNTNDQCGASNCDNWFPHYGYGNSQGYWNTSEANNAYYGAEQNSAQTVYNQPPEETIREPQIAVMKRLVPPRRYNTSKTNTEKAKRPQPKRKQQSRAQPCYSNEHEVPQGDQKISAEAKEKKRQAVEKCRKKMKQYLIDAENEINIKNRLKDQLEDYVDNAQEIVNELRAMCNAEYAPYRQA